jgi:DnaJ homolog subfamily A member 5
MTVLQGDSKTSSFIQCHYQILQIPIDADAETIKKAYRKLALRYHPDKNNNNNINNGSNRNSNDSVEDEKPMLLSSSISSSLEDTNHMFRQVQQAYECLSDPQERRWYDDHRDAILRGWGSRNHQDNDDHNDNDDDPLNLLFDPLPYMHASCYHGYTDGHGDFFQVYQQVFASIAQDENPDTANTASTDVTDDDDKSNDTNDNQGKNDAGENSYPSFGDSHSSWGTVSTFYQYWLSYTTNRNFAWVDIYDIREAPDRRHRRAMQEQNQKYRKDAKKNHIANVIALVTFVQRRDPRVKSYQQQQATEKAHREQQQILVAQQKKEEIMLAREKWRIENEKEMARMEAQDLDAGRIRLADLNDDDDDDDDDANEYGGKKKKKNSKKKKGKMKITFDNENNNEKLTHTRQNELVENIIPSANNNSNDINFEYGQNDELSSPSYPCNEKEPELNNHVGEFDTRTHSCSDYHDDDHDQESWCCECCRKVFRSHGQLDNHLKSKKHKEMFKKFQSVTSE